MKTESAIVISRQTLRKAGAFVGVAGFIALATIGLHMRAASNDAPAPRLLPVEVKTIKLQPNYMVQEFYTGRVEARQMVNLAFEQPGKVAEIAVDEGDFVQSGALIAKLDTALLEASRDQTAASIRRIEAQVELALITEKRQKTLFDQGHSTEQRYDEARLNREALQAQIAEIKAALRTIEINIEKSSLYAPFNAQVGVRNADTGSVLNAGMAVVTLLETTVQQARVSLPSDRIVALRAEKNLSVSFRDEPFAAEIAAVRADINNTTRTQDVLLNIKPDEPIPFGELVELSLPETRVQSGYWVPVEALVEGKKGLWNIFAVEDDAKGSRIARRSVEVIYAETSRVFVTANLTETAKLVGSGTHRVVPGQYIEQLDSGED